MKKDKYYLCCKYVYRSINGVFYRQALTYDGCVSTPLGVEYPVIDSIAVKYTKFKVVMFNGLQEITAWSDKHGNVIVRTIDKSIKQLKINF